MPTDNDKEGAPVTKPASSKQNLMEIVFPPSVSIWNETRKLMGDKNLRTENVATAAGQDPVIVLELIKTANALFFTPGRSPITSVNTAIVRLGGDVVTNLLDDLKDRPRFEDEIISKHFEKSRNKGRRNSLIARMLAEAISRNFADDCQTAALMLCVGHLLAISRLKEKYVVLADQYPPARLGYYLQQKHAFQMETSGLKYLRTHGFPEVLAAAIDREAQSRDSAKAIMKPICLAAEEMVTAFEDGKWERIAPGANLPSRSHLRLLQLSERQYLTIYERAGEFLLADKLSEDRKESEAPEHGMEFEEAPIESLEEESEELALDIETLVKSTRDTKEDIPSETKIETTQKVTTQTKPSAAVDKLLDPAIDGFNLKETKAKKTTARVKRAKPVVAPPPMRTNKANKILESMESMFEDCDNSEDLLLTLLKILVDDGPFEKAALICVSLDRDHAIVVAARGPDIGNGQTLSLDDPLSPLAQCFSRVQSFGTKGSPNSPFGSNTYALAPINVDHQTPVALYADCGNNSSLAFESRRIFRNVVDILNQKLPGIPGGLPVELNAMEQY